MQCWLNPLYSAPLIYPQKRIIGGQAQFIVHEPPTVNDSAAIGPLMTWIVQNLDKELSLPQMARLARMSTRTLSRRFLERVGMTPAKWVTAARVRRAQQLLETTGLAIEEVEVQAGFGSASVLRQHFGGTIGTTPMAYRRNFATPGA